MTNTSSGASGGASTTTSAGVASIGTSLPDTNASTSSTGLDAMRPGRDAENGGTWDADGKEEERRRAARNAILFGICCPVSGMSMNWVIESGYDRTLQAAVTAVSNTVSLILLWIVLALSA